MSLRTIQALVPQLRQGHRPRACREAPKCKHAAQIHRNKGLSQATHKHACAGNHRNEGLSQATRKQACGNPDKHRMDHPRHSSSCLGCGVLSEAAPRASACSSSGPVPPCHPSGGCHRSSPEGRPSLPALPPNSSLPAPRPAPACIRPPIRHRPASGHDDELIGMMQKTNRLE